MKATKWLLVALAVVAALWGGMELRGRSKARSQPLYPNFKQDAAEKITLRSPQGGAVLEKQDEVWTVASEDSFPAEPSVISDMLVTIAAFSRKDRISSNPEKQALYGVDSTGTAVTVEDGKARVLASFVVGGTGPDYQSTYVRDSNSDNVIIAQGNFSHVFNRGARSWQDKRVFALDAEQVVEIGMTQAAATTVIRRGSDGVWYVTQPESAACDQGKASGVASTLAYLRCDGFAGRSPLPGWGVENADSSVYLKTADGGQRTLLIGHRNDNDRYYAATDRGGVVYLLMPRSIKAVLPNPADLLAPLEGSSPAATAPPAPSASRP